MIRPSKRSSEKGFTLIEMIVTIVVIGIIGVGIASFIGRTTEGMIDAAERNKISAIAWIVSEKLSREIRSALPNSVRTVNSGSCIEFVPTIAATYYLSVPVSSDAISFEVVPFPPSYTSSDVNTSQDRVSVYPNASADVYDLSADPHVISSLVASLGNGVTAGSDAITLASSHQFMSDSPTKRLYVVQDPVMFCFDNSGFLYRYGEYGFDSSLGLQNQTVIVDSVSSGSFDYSGATLTRNGVVNIAYSIIGSNGETQAVNQEVQVRNVP